MPPRRLTPLPFVRPADRLRTDVPELADASVVLTGLRADVVAEESRTITDVEPELALEGLRLVFERNS